MDTVRLPWPKLAMNMPETSCKERRIKMAENENNDKEGADGMFPCQCHCRQANTRCIFVWYELRKNIQKLKLSLKAEFSSTQWLCTSHYGCHIDFYMIYTYRYKLFCLLNRPKGADISFRDSTLKYGTRLQSWIFKCLICCLWYFSLFKHLFTPLPSVYVFIIPNKLKIWPQYRQNYYVCSCN
jgi:hypothetical protein